MDRKIITDKLVVEKTGNPLEHWYKLIDKKGGREKSPVELYKVVSGIPALEPLGEWNRNLLATSYAWSRGIRERGERADGFEISVSKTVNVPVQVLYDAWLNDARRAKWLGREKITIRKSTENKSARITWSDNATSLSVDFYSKGADKSQVVVQHQKIKAGTEAARLKEFWTEKLDSLKRLTEE
jgi:hypothetical protein